MESEDKFVITSNYPQKEYLRYLLYNRTLLKKEHDDYALLTGRRAKSPVILDALNDKIAEINKEIEEITNEHFYYKIMDKIFAGECNALGEVYSQDIVETCKLLLSNPTGKTKDIYICFANRFNMQSKQDEQ